MKRFYFNVYQTGDDLCSVIYRSANTMQEAYETIIKDTPFVDRIEFLRME